MDIMPKGDRTEEDVDREEKEETKQEAGQDNCQTGF